MIKIEHRSKLQGAEKFGNCVSCGKERDVFKLYFEDEYAGNASVSLCYDCMKDLERKISKMRSENSNMDTVNVSLCKYSIDGKCTNKDVSADSCDATELQVGACLPYQRAVILTGESWRTSNE